MSMSSVASLKVILIILQGPADQPLAQKGEDMPGSFGDISHGAISPSGLQRRLKVRTMKELCSSPPAHSSSNSADNSATAPRRRSSSTPRRARSAFASPASSPLSRRRSAVTTDGACCSPHGAPRRNSSCADAAPSCSMLKMEEPNDHCALKDVRISL